MEPLDATNSADKFRKSRDEAKRQGLAVFSYVAETTSTNADAAAAARLNPGVSGVFVAGHQTEGRGRRDRQWFDDGEGQLLVSFLLDPGILSPAQAMSVVSLAVCDALRDFEVPAMVKWPNDVVVGVDDGGDPTRYRKLAGVLAEFIDSDPPRIVVGVGLNLSSSPVETGTTVTDAGRPASADEVLARVLQGMSHFRADPEQTRCRYRDQSFTIGQRVGIQQQDRAVVGVAVDVDLDYRLKIVTPSGEEDIDFGDVIHLRPAP